MANSNIFNLGAITVPLAGTEVIPIWNGTTTTKVTVANLTTGRDVSTRQLASIYPNTTAPSLSFGAAAGQIFRNEASEIAVGLENSGAFDLYFQGRNNGGAARNIVFQPLGGWVLFGGSTHYRVAGQGVSFAANTPAAGMTSQLLNWYEEGTWTPAFTTNNGTDGTLAYTSSGRYTRIGRMVHYMGTVTLTDLGSRTNRVQINGLPFSAAGGLYPGIVIAQNVTITAVQMAGEVGNVSFTAVAFALTNSGGALGYLDIAQCTSSSSFWFSGSYSI